MEAVLARRYMKTEQLATEWSKSTPRQAAGLFYSYTSPLWSVGYRCTIFEGSLQNREIERPRNLLNYFFYFYIFCWVRKLKKDVQKQTHGLVLWLVSSRPKWLTVKALGAVLLMLAVGLCCVCIRDNAEVLFEELELRRRQLVAPQ